MHDSPSLESIIGVTGASAVHAHHLARRFTLIVWLVALALTLGAIGFAWIDKSWGALGMALVFGPVANAVLLIGSLIVLAVLKSRCPELRHFQHPLMSAVFAPLLSAVMVFFSVFAMPLHGC